MPWRSRDRDRDARIMDYERETVDRVARLEGEQTAYRLAVGQRMERMDGDINRLKTEFVSSVARVEMMLETRFTMLTTKIDELMAGQGMMSGIGVAVKWIIILGGSGGLIGALVVGALKVINSVPPGTGLPP